MWKPCRELVCAISLFVAVSTEAHAKGGSYRTPEPSPIELGNVYAGGGPLHLSGARIGFVPTTTVHPPRWPSRRLAPGHIRSIPTPHRKHGRNVGPPSGSQ